MDIYLKILLGCKFYIVDSPSQALSLYMEKCHIFFHESVLFLAKIFLVIYLRSNNKALSDHEVVIEVMGWFRQMPDYQLIPCMSL